jgi:hypothetical protein
LISELLSKVLPEITEKSRNVNINKIIDKSNGSAAGVHASCLLIMQNESFKSYQELYTHCERIRRSRLGFLEIIEVIRVNQDQTDANAKATEDLLDRVNDNANAALDHVFKQFARNEKALRPMPPVAGAAGGAPRALICKPYLALKPGGIDIRNVPTCFCMLA